ncbi:hypothetical protein N665_0004s0043 [Sinapis alba]|nr:hypothetical protein N665_0004s0043 [Sinapis alba]
MSDNWDSDKGKKTCVKGTSSSLTKVDVKESSILLPIERIDGCSGSDESGLAMAVPSVVCMENVSAKRLVSDEDLGITSHYPAEIPYCLVQRDARQKDSNFCDSLHSLRSLVVETNLAVGINSMSANETVTDAESGLHESQPCSTVCKFLPENRYRCGSFDAFDTVWNLAVNKNLDENPSRVSSCLVYDSSVIPYHISPLVAVNVQVQNKTFIQDNHSDSCGIMHEENNCAENTDVDAQEEKTNLSVFPCNSVSSLPARSFRQIQSEIHVAATVDETCKAKRNLRYGELIFFAFCGNSVPCDSLSNSLSLYRQIRSEVDVASMVDDTSNYKEKAKPSGGISKCRTPEAGVTSDVGGQKKKYSLNRWNGGSMFDGEAWSYVVNASGTKILGDSGKRYSRALPFVSDTKKDANPPNKRHTWHRKADTSASPFVAAKPLSSTLCKTLFTQPKIPVVTAQSSSGYVRKGNSLLRKTSYGSPGVTLGLPPYAIKLDCIEDKSMGSFPVKTGEITTLERQSNPFSDSCTSKVSNVIVTSSGKCLLSYSRDHLTGLPESIMGSAISEEANVPHSGGDASKTSDPLIQTDYASDCQQKRNHPKLDSSNLKRTISVKRKANQLIAASRNKNQLVRTSPSCVNHSPDDALYSQAATTMVSKISDSAATRPYKRSKFSLVWTQNDPQSRLRTSYMCYQRILPQLVPWRKVTYWRRLMNSVSCSALRNGSFSNSSHKFSMMKKRHTVYTRSTNEYSLRKSKILSIGGSCLKWSKSIERDSRKANEEATLAVVEFSKTESEKHSGQRTTRMTSRNHMTRELVFRIDVDPPCSGLTTESGKGAKRHGACTMSGCGLHDPSKIAVCTKFLNGLCANANCKLTHKVIPERMPDCSYFLQEISKHRTSAEIEPSERSENVPSPPPGLESRSDTQPPSHAQGNYQNHFSDCLSFGRLVNRSYLSNRVVFRKSKATIVFVTSRGVRSRKRSRRPPSTRPHAPPGVRCVQRVKLTRRRTSEERPRVSSTRHRRQPPSAGASVSGHRPSAAGKPPPCRRRASVAAGNFPVSAAASLPSPATGRR